MTRAVTIFKESKLPFSCKYPHCRSITFNHCHPQQPQNSPTQMANQTTRILTRSQSQPQPPSTTTTSSSKIPFRPRKIRKLTTATTTNTKIMNPLTSKGEIDLALNHLRTTDPLFTTLISTHNPPTFPSSHPPFHSLAKSILFQQLATKAATSIYTRFLSLCGGDSQVLPTTILSLSAPQLREIGVSARKASYLHDLANNYVNGTLSDDSILEMDDDKLLTMLTMVKGIGVWSVHMFMIFSLHRPDVLPVGDLGVRKGVQLFYGLKELPKPVEMEQLCDKWRPYRSVGAWYMWRFMEAKGTLPNAGSSGAATSVEAGDSDVLQHL